MLARGSTRLAVVATAAVVLAGLVATPLVVKHRAHSARERRQASAERVVEAFARAWSARDYPAAAALTSEPAATEAALRRTDAALHVTTARVTPIEVGGGRARFAVRLALRGLGSWTYDGALALLARPHEQWVIASHPSLVHPRLREGLRLERTRVLPTRGVVRGARGVDLRGADGELAANVVGRVGPATAADAKQLGVEVGDPVGSSGLERWANARLGGAASGSVRVVDAHGHAVAVLKQFAGRPGVDLRTTLDLTVQQAAERALSGLAKPAALVAIDVRSGAVVAAANNPLGGFGRALYGSYPPGSTFKIVTATAGLLAGRTAGTVLPCPKQTVVGGRPFVNAEGEVLGPVPFHEAFAHSCNTAFVNLVSTLPRDAVASAARLYGFRPDQAKGPLPITSLGGRFPTPTSLAGDAGQSIGQDQVTVSPLQMASVAAAVAKGEWRQPWLTLPVPAGLERHVIPQRAVGPLRQFMAEVVSVGTAKRSGLPAGTYGKTGTAEFGPARPYQTHAWFVGFRGDLAFAVVVEGGGFGGAVAAPRAAAFLRQLPGER